MALTVGIDVGGTKVLAGVVTPDGEVLDMIRRPTPSDDADETAAVIAAIVHELERRHPVVAVGVGAAGWIDATRSVVEHAPNLAWRREPLRARIQDRVDLPVIVENDANAAAWAEYRFGAAQGEQSVLLLTVGTGIGGAIVLDGQVYRGAFGIAGEFGHTRVVRNGLPCGCGARGCFEQYCSGKALVRMARATAAADSRGCRRLLELAGGDVDKIEGPHVTEAARAGDPVAVALFADIGEWLGHGLADLVSSWDPSCIVVGGGVSDAGELLFAPAREAYTTTLAARGRVRAASMRRAALGSAAGLVGAGDLARVG